MALVSLVKIAVLAAMGFTTPHAPAVPPPIPMPAVVHEGCYGDPYVSCTEPGGPIYLAPLDPQPVRAYWHELGHQFDYTVLQDWQRDRFRALTNDERPWRSTPNSPHEKFAEAYAACAMGGRRDGGYGYRPTRRTHRQVCALING